MALQRRTAAAEAALLAIVLALALAATPADASLHRRRLLKYTGNNCVNTLGNTLCGQLSSKCVKAPLLRFLCTEACRACRREQTPLRLDLDPSEVVTTTADGFNTSALHNAYRALQTATPDLAYDAALATSAQKFASKCKFDGTSPAVSDGFGENTFEITGPVGALPSAADGFLQAVGWWYEEIDRYNYSKPGFSLKTGHFTQLVWASSTAVGCGAALCDIGALQSLMLVCNYNPAGNVPDEYQANVQPPV